MQRGVEEAEENAKRKNDNLKLGINGASHSAFAAKKKSPKKKAVAAAAPKKAPKLDVEKISDMAEKLHVELSDEDIAKFTTDDDA
jgi:NH3-dependent NAD+ synthetase